MSNAIRFFYKGPDIPGVQEYQSSRYPYPVIRNFREKLPTLSDAETLLNSAFNDSLQERVKLDPHNPNVAVVDKFFRVQSPAQAPKEEAIQLWSDLSWRCKKICIESCVTAAGFTLVALQGFPMTVVVVLFAGTVLACCYAGWSLQRQHIAEKELLAWQRPGEDFALRRKACLGLPLHKIGGQKSHYHREQSRGTLFGFEILSLFTNQFKQFAEPLMAKQVDTPAQQHQWVVNFFTGNPLTINFFKENPHLPKEKGWKAIQEFHHKTVELEKVLQSIHETYVKADEQQTSLPKDYQKAAAAACAKLKITGLAAQLYQEWLLKALNEEHISKISAFVELNRDKATYFCSLFYPQVRILLEQANFGLLANQPYTLAAIDFNSVAPPFEQELAPINQQYPKNVFDKAMSLSEDRKYQEFLAEVLKALNNLVHSTI